MFTNRKIICFACNRFMSRPVRWIPISRTAYYHKTFCSYQQPEGKNIIPEYLLARQNLTYIQRFKNYMKSERAPMVPMTIIFVGVHVWVISYLFSDEFIEDASEEDGYPIFREFAAGWQAIKDFFKNPFTMFILPPDDEIEEDSIQIDDSDGYIRRTLKTLRFIT